MIDTDKYEGHTEGPWELSPDDWVWAEHLFMQGNTTNYGNGMLITDAPLLLAEVKRLREEVRRLRNIVCLLEDSRITNMSIHDRPELFADVAEVFRQRNEDTHGHLPPFEGVEEE